MKIKVFLVKNSHNFYSLSNLYAAIEDIPNVYAEFVNKAHLVNLNISNLPFDKVLFLFSLNTISFYTQLDAICNIIGTYRNGKTFFVAGGPHPSSSPEDLLSIGVNTVVVGEGESAIRDIILMIKSGKTPPAILRKQVNQLDDYPSFSLKSRYFKPIEITRGCPHGCYFCQTSYLFSKTPKHRSLESIFQHVRYAFSKGIKDFRFITPNALSYMSDNGKVNLDAISRLVTGIRSIIGTEGRIFLGTFPSEIRPEFVNKEILSFLKSNIDNTRIHIGLQSGSNKMLKKSHRGHTLDDGNNAIEIALSCNFHVDVDIIFGMPYETLEDMEKTLELINQWIHKNVTFNVHYFIPLPGTPWALEKPTLIPEYIKKNLERLVGKGKLWGAWKRQMEYFKFFETKKSLNKKNL